MAYTYQQLVDMQSPEKIWEKAGYTKAGWQTDDGQDMWYSQDGENQRTTGQLMAILEEGGFGIDPKSMLPENVMPWGGGDDFSWINQKYGTNFQSGLDYLNYLYGPGGQMIYADPGSMTHAQMPGSGSNYYVLPEGKTAADYVNAPLVFDPPDSGLTKWMPAILGGVALAGMGGLLPGTTSIFGGTPAFAGGASGGTIAGGASGGGALAGGGGLTAAETVALGAAGAAPGASGAFNVADFIKTGAINGVPGALPPALPAASGIPWSTLASGGSALSRILSGEATDDDWLSTLGTVGATGLGLYGANQQADAYGDVAQQYLGLGAPFREKLLQSYAPGFSMADQPDFQNAMDVGAQAAARATSARVGNPVDNPGAYAEMQKYITGSLALPQLNTYRSQLGSFGQLGTNTAGTASMGEASQTGGMYDALGSGLASLTKPKNPYEDLMKGLLGGFKLNTGTSL